MGQPKKSIRDTLIIHPNDPRHMGVRMDKWVYIAEQNSGGFQYKDVGNHLLGGAAATRLTGQKNSDIVKGEIKKGAPVGQLYDLEKDPFQQFNLYNKYPEILKKMKVIHKDYTDKIENKEIIGWVYLDQVRAKKSKVRTPRKKKK